MKIKRHIIPTIQILASVIWLSVITGCSDKSMPIAEDATDISVSFRIVASGSSITRAVEEYGSAIESRIDLNNLKILIFDKDEILHDVIYDNGDMNSDTRLSASGRDEYILVTKLDPTRYNLNSEFAIVALANWNSSEVNTGLTTNLKGRAIDKSQIGSLKISDLREMDFTLNPGAGADETVISWIPEERSLIPMFGSRYTSLRGYDSTRFNESNPMPIPEINLVRSVTKIEIHNRDTESGPAITSIELVNRNTKGWLMQDYTFTSATSNVSSTTLRGNGQPAATNLKFRQEGNSYIAYIPEMDLYNADSRRAICINLDMNGESHQKWVYLAPYSPNSVPILQGPFSSDWDAIKRNYIYRYYINSLAFEFRIEVFPWIYGGKEHVELE